MFPLQLHWPSRFCTDPSVIKPRLYGLAVGGNYAIEIFTDFESGLDFRILVGVVQLDGNWSRELDYHGESVEYAISTATFPTVSDIDLWLSEQGLYPIGFLNEMEFYDPISTRRS